MIYMNPKVIAYFTGPSTSAASFMPLLSSVASYVWAADDTTTGDLIGCDSSGVDQWDLTVTVDTAPGTAASGKQWDFEVYVNSVGTGQICTIFETALSANSGNVKIHMNAGDKVNLRALPTNTPADPVRVTVCCYRSATGQVIHQSIAGQTTIASGQTKDLAPDSGGSAQAVAGQFCNEPRPMPACTTQYLYAKLSRALVGAETVSVTMHKNPVTGGAYAWANSAATLCTFTINAGTDAGNDTTNIISWAVGDLCSIRVVVSTLTGGTPIRVYTGFQMFPTTPNEAVYFYEAIPGAASTTNYSGGVNGVGKTSETGANGAQVPIYPGTVKNLQACFSNTGNTYSDLPNTKTNRIVVRKNTADGNVDKTYTGAGGANAVYGADTSNSDVFARGDLFDIKSVSGSGVGAAITTHYSVSIFAKHVPIPVAEVQFRRRRQ